MAGKEALVHRRGGGGDDHAQSLEATRAGGAQAAVPADPQVERQAVQADRFRAPRGVGAVGEARVREARWGLGDDVPPLPAVRPPGRVRARPRRPVSDREALMRDYLAAWN